MTVSAFFFLLQRRSQHVLCLWLLSEATTSTGTWRTKQVLLVLDSLATVCTVGALHRQWKTAWSLRFLTPPKKLREASKLGVLKLPAKGIPWHTVTGCNSQLPFVCHLLLKDWDVVVPSHCISRETFTNIIFVHGINLGHQIQTKHNLGGFANKTQYSSEGLFFGRKNQSFKQHNVACRLFSRCSQRGFFEGIVAVL